MENLREIIEKHITQDIGLLSVKIDEVNEANNLFETLMGDIVEGRRAFIQENSLKVANLDI